MASRPRIAAIPLPLPLLLFLALGCVSDSELSPPPEKELICEGLRVQMEAGAASASTPAVQRPATPVDRFYARRSCSPAWIDAEGLTPAALELVGVLRAADLEGLSSGSYRLPRIEGLVAGAGKGKGGQGPTGSENLCALDLLLTSAFLQYGAHVSSGRVDPGKIEADWHIAHPPLDVEGALQVAVESGQVKSTLEGLVPRKYGYASLRTALARYRALAEGGGWRFVPISKKLRKGDDGPVVPLLAKRLAAEEYLENDASSSMARFGDALDQAVRSFQRTHGLEPDGVVGAKTIKELNVPASDRARQIAVNMERLRWLPRNLGDRYILVDIAGFRVSVVEEDNDLITMRAIVGMKSRPTPVFSGTINRIVFNPYWRVPKTIAVEDKLAKILEDPEYLQKESIKVFLNKPGARDEIDPATIDWSSLSEEKFPYLLRQEPGPGNALGRVKFMFPNRFSVYLHDTPSRNLFAMNPRTFSSGCIRVAKPVDLGEYLLSGEPGWNREKFNEAIETGKNRSLRLRRPIPVHLVYLTAWVNEEDNLEFRRDIYERDKVLDRALGAESLIQSKSSPAGVRTAENEPQAPPVDPESPEH